jgi:radical SAM protein with 4Fe4S-binding SPASM domain
VHLGRTPLRDALRRLADDGLVEVYPRRGIYVGASGEALPCARLRTPQRLSLGNMRGEGVVHVWNGDAYREFRERLASSDPPDICRGCAVYAGMV